MKTFQQTRGVRRAAPKAARAAADIVSGLAQKTRFADPALSDNWPTIAGAEIAALGRPGRITGVSSGKTLEVIVRDGADAAALQMRSDALLQAVNRYLGPGAVARIAIRQRAGVRPATGLSADDSPLGAALSSFRSAVKARNPSK